MAAANEILYGESTRLSRVVEGGATCDRQELGRFGLSGIVTRGHHAFEHRVVIGARASYGIKIGGLGHVDGSALKAQHVQCLAETCAPSTRSVEHIPWEVAPRAPVQGR